MSRRTIAIILIVLGVLSGIAIIVWLWWPYRKATNPTPAPVPAAQPPAYPSDTSVASSTPIDRPVQVPPSSRTQITLDERRLQETLRHRAVDIASRAGTYANSDEFAGIKQVYVDATPSLQAFLETQRLELVKQHPMRAAIWSQTTRVLSSKIISAVPIQNNTTVDIQVQAQVVSGPDGETVKTYKQAVVTFALSEGTWSVNRIVWSDLNF